MTSSDRPNILFILADDLGWADLSIHGSPVRTPNIDLLASEGVEFEQHYVCPVCTPTRTCLLTGRYPGRFGPHATVPSNAPVLPDGYPTLATALRDAGYDTGLFGKWHLGSSPRFGPNHYGFNASYGSLAGGVDPYNHRYKRGDFTKTWHRNCEPVEEPGHVTDLILREAVSWIESRDRPWFCYVPFTAVHIPVKPPQSWLAGYASQQFDDNPGKDTSCRKYAAYTSHMDHAVGELVEALERTSQRERTLIVFSSDNGAIDVCPIDYSNSYPGWQEAYPRLGSNLPFRGIKGDLYEGGIRTPTLANWRGTLEARREGRPAHVVDWMPTLTKLAGTAPPSGPALDGMDIWPLITDETSPRPDRHMCWNHMHGVLRAVRHGDWKLVVHDMQHRKGFELFNIAADPHESPDVASDHPKKVEELLDLIARDRAQDGTSKRKDVHS